MSNIINADNGVVSTVPGLKYSADTSGELILQTNTTNALTLDTTQGASFATGVLVNNPYAGSYSSGMLLDHTTSLGRISVGPSSDIAFYTNAIASRVETMRITSAGNVGIGTNSPASFGGTNLQVQSSSAAAYASVLLVSGTYTMEALVNQNAAVMAFGARSNHHLGLVTNDTERMRITSTGIVDIGGTSGGSVGELLVVEGANSAGHRAARINNTGTTNGYSTLWMGSSNDGLLRGGSTAGAFTDQLSLLTSGATPISFYTTNTERMRITSAGFVGIGTSSPSAILNPAAPTQTDNTKAALFVSDSATITKGVAIAYDGAANYGYIQTVNKGVVYTNLALNWEGGNVLVGGTTQRLSAKITNYGSYWSGSGNSSGDAEYFLSNYATPTVAWAMSVRQDVGGANNDLKFLRLNSSGVYQGIAMQITQAEGNVTLAASLGIGSATATTSGTGITFPATQSPSSNANTLDDYEEGTWTPTVTSAGYSIASSSGKYTKIGNVVYCQISFVFATVNGSSTSQAILSGGPFSASTNGTGAIREGSVGGAIYMFQTAGSNNFELNSMDGVVSGSQRTIRINENYSGTFFYYV
jgi:hypothetical protein